MLSRVVLHFPVFDVLNPHQHSVSNDATIVPTTPRDGLAFLMQSPGILSLHAQSVLAHPTESRALARLAFEHSMPITLAAPRDRSALLNTALHELPSSIPTSFVWTYETPDVITDRLKVMSGFTHHLRYMVPPLALHRPYPLECLTGMIGAGKTETQTALHEMLHMHAGILSVIRAKTERVLEKRKSEPDVENSLTKKLTVDAFREFEQNGALDSELTYPHPKGEAYGLRGSFQLCPHIHQFYVSRIDGVEVATKKLVRYVGEHPAKPEVNGAVLTRPVRVILLNADNDTLIERIIGRYEERPNAERCDAIVRDVQQERQAYDLYLRSASMLLGQDNVREISTSDASYKDSLPIFEFQPRDVQSRNAIHAVARAVLGVMSKPLRCERYGDAVFYSAA